MAKLPTKKGEEKQPILIQQEEKNNTFRAERKNNNTHNKAGSSIYSYFENRKEKIAIHLKQKGKKKRVFLQKKN